MSYGLALSGGAACGLANLGIVRVLEQENLRPACISGSSMGAIVAALYAFKPEQINSYNELKKLSISTIAHVSKQPLKGGLHGGMMRQALEKHLHDVFDDATIADCTIPFVCVAAKILQPIDWTRIIRHDFADYLLECAEPYIFPPNTRLIDAIMASSAIPVLFSPIKIEGQSYIDLVHFGSIPSRSLRNTYHPNSIIGTDTNPYHDTLKHLLPDGWNNFLERGYQELEQSKQACDLIIRPTMKYSPLRFDKAEEFAEAGKNAAINMLPQIRATILDHHS